MKLLKLLTFSLLLIIAATSCNSNQKLQTEAPEEQPENLEDVWKLTGIVDVETNELRVLEPKDCDKCYTLKFNTDSTFSTLSSINVLGGAYKADYITNSIHIFNFGGTKIGETGDGYLWWDIFPTIQLFSMKENELRLYYNNKKNYLLFKLLEL